MSKNAGNSEDNRGKRSSLWILWANVCVTCVAASILSGVLFLSVIFVLLDVPHGFESLSLRVLIREIFESAIVPLVVYLSQIVKSLFPWPILVLSALALIAWGPDKLRELIAALRFEVAGVKFEGLASAPEKFKKEFADVQRITAKTNDELEQAYHAASEYAEQLRAKHKIDLAVARISKTIYDCIGVDCPDDFRVTVYIPDLLFEDRLYQLTEYYNKEGHPITENRAGRVYSIRYGIIGRVWRSGVPEVEGRLISEEDQNLIKDQNDIAELERFIARRWGLTLEEAAKVRPYNSYGAIRIDGGGIPRGLVFFDSKKKDAFPGKDMRNRIDGVVQSSELAGSLVELTREINQFPRVQIYRGR